MSIAATGKRRWFCWNAVGTSLQQTVGTMPMNCRSNALWNNVGTIVPIDGKLQHERLTLNAQATDERIRNDGRGMVSVQQPVCLVHRDRLNVLALVLGAAWQLVSDLPTLHFTIPPGTDQRSHQVQGASPSPPAVASCS